MAVKLISHSNGHWRRLFTERMFDPPLDIQSSYSISTLRYFILGSEIMENIGAIKVVTIYSEMIWYHFTVD